jgi:TatD DNase family protein
MLVDTHCHLDWGSFDDDRDAVIERALAVGVTRIIVPAIDLENGETVLRLAEQYDAVYAAVGVHPNSTADWQDGWLAQIRAWAAHEKVVAIGEIGLDYYWDKSPLAVQQHAFTQQLALAVELGLPVIVHNREASADVLRLLAASPLAGRAEPGVLHSFAGDEATAVAALNMGYYLGFTGPITYKKADDLRQIARRVPADRLLVETDAPFLPPTPHRGKRNEPAYVAYVAERLAAERGVDTAVLYAQTSANAYRLFARMGGSGK